MTTLTRPPADPSCGGVCLRVEPSAGAWRSVSPPMRAVAYLDQSHLDEMGLPELYQLDKERDLVGIVAAHRGFQLGPVFEAAAGATREDALAAVRAGEADALIAPRVRSLCSN